MVVERVELVGGTHPARCARQCQCDIVSQDLGSWGVHVGGTHP